MTHYNNHTITLEHARATGVSAASLRAVADWNDAQAIGRNKSRRRRQAAQLRQVAAALGAVNDNAVGRRAA
jgi:hypothetical protein